MIPQVPPDVEVLAIEHVSTDQGLMSMSLDARTHL